MAEAHKHFIPAAGHDWLLFLYDPLQKVLGFDAVARQLVEQAGLAPGQRVLEIGCGTGNVTVAVKRAAPRAEVVGLDPDPKALGRAARKAEQAGVEISFDEGFADAMPYPDASFDRVLSSLMLHHLDPETKRKALAECRRVLRPGGSLHVLDFGGSEERADGILGRLLHPKDTLSEQYAGGIPTLLREAGFDDAAETGHRRSLFGRIGLFRGAAGASTSG